MLASQLRDSIGFSSVQANADKHSKDRPGVPESKGSLRQPAFPFLLWRSSLADASRLLHPLSPQRRILPESLAHAFARTGELVNNIFIRLAALVAVLAYPGTASAQGGLRFANHGVVAIAASPALA
jgi:hypothetical protein